MNEMNQAPKPAPSTGKKTGALATGIVGLVLSVIGLFFFYAAIPALILGIVAVSLAVMSGKEEIPATGGMVTGILAIVFSSISIACVIACASAIASMS